MTVSDENWKYCRGMVEYKGYLYLVCNHIFKLDPTNGKYEIVSHESNWNWTKNHSVCVYKDKFIMVDGWSGKLIQWNPEDSTYSTINGENWKSTRSIVCLGEKVLVVGNYIYDVDIKTGKYVTVSKQGGWNYTISTTIGKDKIYLLTRIMVVVGIGHHVHPMYFGRIYSFDPENGDYILISNHNWKNCSEINSCRN